jgi:hypothetical protein
LTHAAAKLLMSRTVAMVVVGIIETIFRAEEESANDKKGAQDNHDEFNVHLQCSLRLGREIISLAY